MSNNPIRIFLNLFAFMLIWEFLVDVLKPPLWLLPPPSVILLELASAPKLYFLNSVDTLITTLAGFLTALVIGTLLAVGIVFSRAIDNAISPLLISFNSIPKIAMAPLFIIWLGTGGQSRIAVSFLIAFFPVVIDTVLGLRSTDPDALDLMKTMRGSWLQALIKLRIPNALPYMFSGMKMAIVFSLVGAIAGEFIASQSGLGSMILAAQGMFLTDRVFAALILLGVLGTLLFYAIDVAERFFCPWHVAHRKDSMPAAHI